MSKAEEIKREKEWRAEDDARTLIEYQRIFKDKERMKEAKRKLKERQDEIEKALK